LSLNAKRFSQSCENNKSAIAEHLIVHFAKFQRVLEIASGTGQHAAHFAGLLPHLQWLCSDLEVNHAGIQAWIDEAELPNLHSPVSLDVRQWPWPVTDVDAVFSANCAHIMHWSAVCDLFKGVSKLLPSGGQFMLYGPFNYSGTFTSPGNAAFDAQLKSEDPGMGIRDYEALNAMATDLSLLPIADYAMPANNRFLVWQRA
jgi:cyclopropane fatty-acyl-phospholipid synthase-like methyltransferase